MAWENIPGMAESRSQIAAYKKQAEEMGAAYFLDVSGIDGQPDFPEFCMDNAELKEACLKYRGRHYAIWLTQKGVDLQKQLPKDRIY